MPFAPDQSQVHAFLQDPTHRNGVLAYLGMNGDPDTSFVSFSATPNLEIIFGTSRDSHKYPLLWNDRRVANNVTDHEARYTVQLKGRIYELKPAEMVVYEEDHYGKLGESSRKFKDLPDQRFFIIRPTWLRFSDCLEEPWMLTTIIGDRR